MKVFAGLLEKTYFLPLSHLSSGDNSCLFFQTRGDGLYPLIKDGDILKVQQTSPSELQAGDLTLLERPSGQLAVHCVLKNRNRLNGYKGPVRTGKLVGRVVTVDRNGQTNRRTDRLARLSHFIYFSAKPFLIIPLIGGKVLSLLHPRFFVKDPVSSLRGVVEKYNDTTEVRYYSHRAFEGLDEKEQHLVEQFMGQRGRVLNVGCGAGREAFALARQGFDIVGVDVAPLMIEEAKRHAQTSGINVHFEAQDATALGYPPNSFDYVLISEAVYSHIPTRQLRINTLKKIRNLLVPNGIMFFSVLYRKSSFLSRFSLYSAFLQIAKPLVKKRLHFELGDILVRYVSPVGTQSKLCYLHFFKDAAEVLEELSSAGLDGFEHNQSGYWIVKPRSHAIPREVDA